MGNALYSALVRNIGAEGILDGVCSIGSARAGVIYALKTIVTRRWPSCRVSFGRDPRATKIGSGCIFTAYVQGTQARARSSTKYPCRFFSRVPRFSRLSASRLFRQDCRIGFHLGRIAATSSYCAVTGGLCTCHVDGGFDVFGGPAKWERRLEVLISLREGGAPYVVLSDGHRRTSEAATMIHYLGRVRDSSVTG